MECSQKSFVSIAYNMIFCQYSIVCAIEGIRVSRFGGFRGCGIFSGNCIVIFSNMECQTSFYSIARNQIFCRYRVVCVVQLKPFLASLDEASWPLFINHPRWQRGRQPKVRVYYRAQYDILPLYCSLCYTIESFLGLSWGYDRFHWKCYAPGIHHIEKLEFLSTNSD